MRARLPILLLALSTGACSTPDSGSPERAPSPMPAATPAAEPAAPDAGARRPQPAGLALGRPMLVDFTREDCLPCKLMEPWLAELRRRHAGRIEVLELDLDRPENKEIARFFKAKSVPMQVYVDARGREVARGVGLATLQQMQNRLERLGFVKKD
jgi:thioredoxin 1